MTSNKFCSYCGSTVLANDVFCKNCGASLDEFVEPTTNVPIQQEPYRQTTYTQQETVYIAKTKSSDGAAIVAMVFGVASVIIQFIPFIVFSGIISGVIAIITGAVSMRKAQKKHFAIIGVVLGAIGIILWVVFYILGIRFNMFSW